MPLSLRRTVTDLWSQCATIGKIVDLGITDPVNMGAAMAPAAVDTIQAHFNDTGRQPGDYDLIVTGDLATVGHTLRSDLLAQRWRSDGTDGIWTIAD